MARITKKKETAKETAVVTRAEKKDATKNLIREILAIKPLKHNELIDEVSKLYTERYGDESDNVNDVRGRVGSVLDIMKKESDVMSDGGMYALKARTMPALVEEPTLEQPVEQPTEPVQLMVEQTLPPVEAEEKPSPKKRGRKPKAKAEPAPEEPVAVVEPVSVEEVKTETPVPELVEEKPAPKKRGRKPKAKAEETPPVAEPEKANEAPVVEVKAEELPAPVVETPAEKPVETPVEAKAEEPTPPVEPIKEEVKPVVDMSFLLGNIKPTKEPEQPKEQPKKAEKKDPVQEQKQAVKTETKAEKAPVKEQKREEVKPVKQEPKTPVKQEVKPPVKQEPKQAAKPQNEAPRVQANVRKLPQGATLKKEGKSAKPLTAEEKLRESFLSKLRSLGGDYFEYYSVYLLERYSMKNGRRLESLRVSGGDRDGGIDGEIELTDKMGFRETIYIQSKNWNPEKGDERLWIVGETLLQQFIGACACRQAQDGKQNCRGIFITTSRFTPEAKRILDTMSDKIVGYDGDDVFEAAKECGFGVVQKNGQWVVDENLLSGTKAFFNL